MIILLFFFKTNSKKIPRAILLSDTVFDMVKMLCGKTFYLKGYKLLILPLLLFVLYLWSRSVGVVLVLKFYKMKTCAALEFGKRRLFLQWAVINAETPNYSKILE